MSHQELIDNHKKLEKELNDLCVEYAKMLTKTMDVAKAHHELIEEVKNGL